MKVIILAAGYATRLYPLTLTQPKPLLAVAGKPMVEHVLDNLAAVGGLERIYVVTNAKFAGHFQKWSDDYSARAKLQFTVVNDGSTDDSNKLGAIGDIHYVIKTHNVDDDLIVVAGDNLFSEKLDGFGKFCREKNAPVLALYDVGNLEEIKKYNSISLDGDGRIKIFRGEAEEPHQHADGHRALLLSQEQHPAHQAIHCRGKQSRPAGAAGAVALPAHARLYLARARRLVRHRVEGDARRSQQDLRKTIAGTTQPPGSNLRVVSRRAESGIRQSRIRWPGENVAAGEAVCSRKTASTPRARDTRRPTARTI